MRDLTPDRASLDPIEIASRDEITSLQLARLKWTVAHACNSDNVVTVAQQCQVNFLKSARLGDTLRATAALRALSGRTGLYDVAITDQHEVLIAEFRGMSRKLSGSVVPPDGGSSAD